MAVYFLFLVLIMGSQLSETGTTGIAKSSGPEDCKADEEWKEDDCHCKEEYKVSSLKDVKPELSCGQRSMKASFHKCQMKELNAYFNEDNILEDIKKCFDYQDDNEANTFSVVAHLNGSCGVTPSEDQAHVTFLSTFNITLHDGLTTRNDTLTVLLSCVYDLDMITSLYLAVEPVISIVEVSVSQSGTFLATMALYQDINYTIPYQGPEVKLSVDTILYIGVFINGGDSSKYVLVMKDCYATPSEFQDDPIKYYIIKDRCPNKKNETVVVHENGESRKGRVAVQLFKFINYKYVYLHCSVGLCNTDEDCKPSCDGTSRSAQADLKTGHLKIGPLTRSDIDSFGIVGAQMSWVLIFSSLLLLVI